VPEQSSPLDWDGHQRQYWEAVAKPYALLYLDPWSQRENHRIASKLHELISDGQVVLDLGCGHGLGFHLLKETWPIGVGYVGVDTSSSMLRVGNGNGVKALVRADMQVLPFANGSVDCTVSLFSAMSYLADPSMAIAESARVLRDGGTFLMMFISRWSLRRLVRFRFHSTETYGTRALAMEGVESAPVKVHSLSQLNRAMKSVGMSVEHVFGQTVFKSGSRWPGAWSISELVGGKVPSLGHAICLVGRKGVESI
jgi:ubiquinone/menaquinone biosynthesis C-methylase UbiE